MHTPHIRLFTAVSVVLLVSAFVIIHPHARPAQDPGTTGAIGLNLFFQNGTMSPLTLVGDAPRYLQEIDIVATVTSAMDQGIDPLMHTSEFSSLNWKGVEMVEEDWRPAGDGTFIRQHFYRGAQWMEQASEFKV